MSHYTTMDAGIIWGYIERYPDLMHQIAVELGYHNPPLGIPLEDADSERLVPLAEALAFMPERVLSADEAAAVRHGRRVPADESAVEHTRLTHEGEILAIGEPRGGELQPVVVFAPA